MVMSCIQNAIYSEVLKAWETSVREAADVLVRSYLYTLVSRAAILQVLQTSVCVLVCLPCLSQVILSPQVSRKTLGLLKLEFLY